MNSQVVLVTVLTYNIAHPCQQGHQVVVIEILPLWDPPDTPSQPLPGTVVRLVRYSESAILINNITAKTKTDEFGNYVLRAAPGRYWLTATAPGGQTVILSMDDPNFAVDFLINVAEEIEIALSKPAIYDFVIWELGTM